MHPERGRHWATVQLHCLLSLAQDPALRLYKGLLSAKVELQPNADSRNPQHVQSRAADASGLHLDEGCSHRQSSNACTCYQEDVLVCESFVLLVPWACTQGGQRNRAVRMTLPGSGRAVQALLCCSACKCILNFGSAARRDWGAGKKGNYRRTLRAMLCLHCDRAAMRRPVRTARAAKITISWSQDTGLWLL